LEVNIYKSSSRDKLDQIIAEAKAKGVELIFDKIKYNDKKQLTNLSGTLKKENSKSTFSVTDFEVITLLVVKEDGKYSCLVHMADQREEN
jgi:hypothetical protein